MRKKKRRDRTRTNEARPAATGPNRADTGPDSGGQSGSTQQLPRVAESSSDDVEDLAATGQAVEAGVLEGVEKAAERPEKEATTDHPRQEDNPRK